MSDGMAYLVTGGSGCIGAYVIRDLLRQGKRVVNLDADASGGVLGQVLAPDTRATVTTIRGDIRDAYQVNRVLKEQGIDRVIHLASLQIPASHADPASAVAINVGGLLNILEAARVFPLASIVWASSVAVYGPPADYPPGPVANASHHRPGSVYGATKSLGEFLLDFYHREYGIPGVGFRFTAVYGVGRDRGRSSFTTEMIKKAVAGEAYEVPFGDDILDWQYVEDVSRLIVTASEAGPCKTRVFNTRGDYRPVKDGVDYLRRLVPDARLSIAPGAFGITWNYDTEPLERELGFVPEYSMEDGIHRTLNLYRAAAGKPPVPKP
jgi:UDP-glucose 4-epimerase